MADANTFSFEEEHRRIQEKAKLFEPKLKPKLLINIHLKTKKMSNYFESSTITTALLTL